MFKQNQAPTFFIPLKNSLPMVVVLFLIILNTSVQAAPALTPPIFNFDGLGFQNLDPPGTVGDVGPNHYVQMVNASVVNIYDKSGSGIPLSTFDLDILAPPGSPCSDGRGDPIVLYDHLADRWVLSEFRQSSGGKSSLCLRLYDPQSVGDIFCLRLCDTELSGLPQIRCLARCLLRVQQ